MLTSESNYLDIDLDYLERIVFKTCLEDEIYLNSIIDNLNYKFFKNKNFQQIIKIIQALFTMNLNEYTHENITFFKVSDKDLALIKNWVETPHVQRWWPDSWSDKAYRDISDIAKDIFVDNSMIVRVGDTPIGLSQVYSSLSSLETVLGFDECGIRFFIGDPAYLKQRIGRAVIKELVKEIFQRTQFERIICEPQADNWPAIITLKRAGFRDHGRVQRPNCNLVRLSLVRSLHRQQSK